MKSIKKAVSLFAALTLALSVFCGIGFSASAAGEKKVVDLIKDGKAKTFGRYTEKDGKMSAFWGGNGFEINVKSNGGDLCLKIDTNDRFFMAAFVDGETQEREVAVSNTHSNFYVSVPKGEHTVRIIRDTQINTDASKYAYFDTVSFDGEFLDAPKDNKMYIEIIGDSIAAGDGAAGEYKKGQAWTDPDDHSIIKGFAYKLATRLNADYSIIARGGIGLYKDNSGSQESISTELRTTMQDIYDYTNGYADMVSKENRFDFKRKPDLIIFELSGNDNTKDETKWREEVVNFINHVREVYGSEMPVVWSGKNQIHATTINNIIKEGALKNFYCCQYEYGGSGAAALATQTSGHPNAGEQTKIMENLVEFMQKNNVIKVPDENSAKEDGKQDNQKDGNKSSLDIKKIAIPAGIGAVVVIIIIIVIVAAVKSGKKKEDKNEEENKQDKE